MPGERRLLEEVKVAWDELWAVVKLHPEIVVWDETNALVQFSHRILSRLEACEGLRPWESVVPCFDDPDSLRLGGVVIWETLVSALRPDIVLRIKPTTATLGVIVELKCIRSIMCDYTSDSEGTISKRRRQIAVETGRVLDDLSRLREFVKLKDAKSFLGIMCVLHVHDDKWGDPSEILADLKWDAFEPTSQKNLTVRRAWQVIELPSEGWEYE